MTDTDQPHKPTTEPIAMEYLVEFTVTVPSILESLPLYQWMEISVAALAQHPNDPALTRP